jgi:hypothetical protein
MKARLIKLACLAAVAGSALAVPGIASAAWTKTYVVEWYEPAMYYGAPQGIIDPGTDCPKGSNAEPNWIKVMMDAGYTREEAEWIRSPANPTRSAVHGQNQMAFRGADRANVYIHPTSTAESGNFYPVAGKVSEGLDLDGDTKNGFVSPTGQTGIDNQFYRALGCWKTYRAPPRKSSGSLQFNDSMRDGSWTVVIVVNGQGKDPMNDKNVTVGFYMSSDKLVKDANGSIARDYTFRISPDAQYEALLKGSVAKGKITTQATPEVYVREPGYTKVMQLLKAKATLQMEPDGSLKGYLGGYRPWQPVYDGWVKARGPVIESLTWVRLPDVYYALKRYADYAPTPGGEKTHISTALRVEAIPAFVMSPDAKVEVASVTSYKAMAPKPVAAPPSTFRVIDGLVIAQGGAAVSQTPEQLRPPVRTSSEPAKPVAANTATTVTR